MEDTRIPTARSRSGLLCATISGLRSLCALVLAAMLLLVAVNVASRTILNVAFDFTEEFAGYAMVALTFLGAAVAQFDGANFRVEILFERFHGRMRRLVELVSALLALGVTGVMGWEAARLVLSSHARGIVSTSGFAVPQYLPQFLVPVGLAILALVLAGQIIEGMGGLISGRKSPDDRNV